MIGNELYVNYLHCLLSGNRSACAETVRKLLADGITMKELYIGLFQKSMYEVGEMWETNRISVAVEHIATSITENLIGLAYPLIFSTAHCGKKAVVTCAPGEFHQLGARMVADYFEMNGWDGYFLGSNTPLNDLMEYIKGCKPDLLAVSMSVYFNLDSLTELIMAVRQKFPGLLILAGGQGFRRGPSDFISRMENVQVLLNFDELDSLIFKMDEHAN